MKTNSYIPENWGKKENILISAEDGVIEVGVKKHNPNRERIDRKIMSIKKFLLKGKDNGGVVPADPKKAI